jgi:hypothetical protein
MKLRKPNTDNLRIKELDLFKWKKEGIILTYGSGYYKRIININENILTDRDGTLDFLYSLLDLELPKQQILDIKEVISEFIE